MSGNLRFNRVGCSDGNLHYAEIGDAELPLIICLHGFPEYWAAWRDVIHVLSDQFHLVAPDQRGFNRSLKPVGVDSYQASRLVQDLACLADKLSPGRPFVLAGHDWGAAVAYAFAIANPHRVSRLIVANGVHPACFQRAIFEDPDQRAASQYINRLREAGAAERMLENGFARTLNMIEGFSHTHWMTAGIRAEYLKAWSRPGAMEAMLNWYRASSINVPALGDPAPESKLLQMPVQALAVSMPHLVIWGDDDEALRPSCLIGLERYAADLTIRRVSGAGHWILHEKPDEVAKLIAEFLD